MVECVCMGAKQFLPWKSGPLKNVTLFFSFKWLNWWHGYRIALPLKSEIIIQIASSADIEEGGRCSSGKASLLWVSRRDYYTNKIHPSKSIGSSLTLNVLILQLKKREDCQRRKAWTHLSVRLFLWLLLPWVALNWRETFSFPFISLPKNPLCSVYFTRSGWISVVGK